MPGLDGLDSLNLRRPKGVPSQRIDDVVLKRWVQLLKFAHSSISSTDVALAAARSTTDISLSAKVRV